jgi:hypothetical protein
MFCFLMRVSLPLKKHPPLSALAGNPFGSGQGG